METLDQRRILAPLYSVKAQAPTGVDVPQLTVLAWDGVGDPGTSSDFRAAVESLMALAWGIRARRKAQEPPVENKVMPLEGQWSLPEGVVFAEDPAVRDQLRWSMQIVQPPDVTRDELAEVRAEVARKKRNLTRLGEVRLEELPASRAMTLLHIGPYVDEPVTIRRIYEAIRGKGHEPASGHREIYLSDPRRVVPEKLKTILRVTIRSS